jgi:hypothetical protein
MLAFAFFFAPRFIHRFFGLLARSGADCSLRRSLDPDKTLDLCAFCHIEREAEEAKYINRIASLTANVLFRFPYPRTRGRRRK